MRHTIFDSSFGNKLGRLVGKTYCQLTGWSMANPKPTYPKYILLGAPHTTNWDGIVGMFFTLAYDLKIYWMVKNSLVRWPVANFLQWLGAIPINRNSTNNIVDQMAEHLANTEQITLVIAPESTRKRVDRWKTGFYYIALKANIPIVPGYIDYRKKVIGFGPALFPTGDIDADLAQLKRFYQPIEALYPEAWNIDAIGAKK